jgi:hypothetical protein
MADLSKLKQRRSSLGKPPPAAEASPNLQAAETAPSAISPKRIRTAETRAGQGGRARDGRSARRTGRTVQFATRVSPEFDEQLRAIAARDGLLLVEVLERALDAYEKVRS